MIRLNEVIDSSVEGYKKTRIIQLALEIGLFDHLRKPCNIASIAKKYGFDERLTGLLLENLSDLDLVVSSGGYYLNSEITNKYILKDSQYSQSVRINREFETLEKWDQLPKAMKEGGLERKVTMFTDDWITSIGQWAMCGPIKQTMGILETAADLKRCRSMIDVGGGHGLYTVAFKERYPNLKCSIFDQPQIIDVAERNFKEFGIKVSTQRGDFYEKKIEGTYDLVFASHNRSAMDPYLAEMMSGLVNKGGFLILRRHATFERAPLMALEWSLVRSDNKNNEKHQGPFDFNEYVRIMCKKGLIITYRVMMDNVTELVIFQKS